MSSPGSTAAVRARRRQRCRQEQHRRCDDPRLRQRLLQPGRSGTNALIAANPGLEQVKANAAAWRQGKRLLERAVAERLDFAFETTLGGGTMTRILADAAAAGFEVRIFYVGTRQPGAPHRTGAAARAGGRPRHSRGRHPAPVAPQPDEPGAAASRTHRAARVRQLDGCRSRCGRPTASRYWCCTSSAAKSSGRQTSRRHRRGRARSWRPRSS